jgi:hypothetical protein
MPFFYCLGVTYALKIDGLVTGFSGKLNVIPLDPGHEVQTTPPVKDTVFVTNLKGDFILLRLTFN